jgi:hypothetical protein
MLVYNASRLLELDGGKFYVNTIVWREEWAILFVLLLYIHGLDRNPHQPKVMRGLKFLFCIASLGCVARYRASTSFDSSEAIDKETCN